MQIMTNYLAAAAAALALAVHVQNASTQSSYYGFPALQDANSTDLFPMPTCHGYTILEATVDQLQDYMTSGNLTSVQLTVCYLQRQFQTHDYINAMLEINPDVLDIAAAMDEERRAGKIRGPLHGIPFAVKDNIGTKDKMQTTAGSWALQGSIIPREAHVVTSLRNAGAVLMGKTTLSEWADMRSNIYSEGYSPRGGQCRSAYNLTVNPGGSSSGSGVGVAANVFPIALGTETDGSVINPAQRNAIVGIKPTVGLTSRDGVIPESLNQDTVGVFGKTVRDATYALDAIYGIDPHDNETLAQTGKTPIGGYTPFLTNKLALQNATFGIPWSSFWVYADSHQQSVLLSLISLLETAGATIVNNTELPHHETIVSPDGWNWDYGSRRGYPNESEYTYIKVDFYNDIATYLSGLNKTDIKSLDDIVQFNYDNDGTEGGHPYQNGTGIPAFSSGQDGFLASLATKGIRDSTYWSALNFCRHSTREAGIDAALAMPPNHTNTNNNNNKTKTRLDGLLVPADVAQAPQIAAQAGYPMITIPAGTHENGMPFGLGIMQTGFSEGELVRWASAIEDLQLSSDTASFKRSLPRWRDCLRRNIPVL